MEGRSGTGRLGTKYFYYVCRNKDCGLRVSAGEIEDAVVGRIGELSRAPALLESLVCETNARLQRQAPALAKRKKALQRSLDTVKSDAEKILGEWSGLDGSEAKAFLTDKLNDLGRRKTEVQAALIEAEDELLRLGERAVSAEQVRSALLRFSDVYACLKPHEQKELVRLVVHRAEVHDRKIVLEINGSAPTVLAGAPSQGASRFGSSNWLPGLVSQSAIRDAFAISLRSLKRWSRKSRGERTCNQAETWRTMLAKGEVKNRSELARREGFSRARITQVLGPGSPMPLATI